MIIVKLNYNKLRGRIKEVLGTEGAFAKAIGRSQNYITKVFQGKSFFTQVDVYNACAVLDISTDEIGIYFFASDVTNPNIVAV